ncbi:hypothetical protein ACLKA6_015401 [Drosophila palustris]
MHWDVTCDGCEKTNLVYYRYKCLRCDNYDLCSVCYENKVETGPHSMHHPFQCLLDRAARELFFGGGDIPELCADSFTCPICGKMGHAVKDLVKHVQSKHRGDNTPVICPLCVAVPSADTVRMSNLVNHVSIMHGTSILRIGGGAGSNQAVFTTGFELPPAQTAGVNLSRERVLTHAQVHAHAHARGPGPGPGSGHAYGHAHGHGRVIGCCTGASQWSRGLASSASLDGDLCSHPQSAWLAPDQSSLSGSMHTMRDTDLGLGNMSQLLRQEYQQNANPNPSPAEPPLASDEIYSDIDSDDFAADDARI